MKIWAFLLGAIIILGVFYYLYDNTNIFSKDASVESPIPSLLTKSFPKALANLNIWSPNDNSSASKDPGINVVAGASYDLTTNKYLYENNIDKHLPIASLTKIMTAIVALENMDINQNVTIDSKAANIGEDSMGLRQGESLQLKDLLYGLILNSGNDAAEAIAAASPFGRDNFVYLMNKKAEDLGLSDTHFTNPTGLQGDGVQYSTVHDLIVLTRYALQNSVFTEVAKTYEHDIPLTDTHKAYTLYNETNLLTSYPGVEGVKTGFTDEAGYCLVTYLNYQGHQIIGIVLNADNRRQDMKDLLDYSLKQEGIKPPPHS